MKIVHIKTSTETLFGVLDDDLNMVSTVSSKNDIHRLDVGEFVKLVNGLSASKAELTAQLEAELAKRSSTGLVEELEAEAKAKASVEVVETVQSAEQPAEAVVPVPTKAKASAKASILGMSSMSCEAN